MRRAAVVCLSVVALIGGLTTVPEAAAAPAVGPPYTSMGMAAGVAAQDSPPEGGAESYDGDAVHANQLTTTSVSLNAFGAAITFSAQAPTGRTFRTGDVLSVGSADATHAAVSAGLEGRSCFARSGSLTVVEAVAGGDGTLTAFGVDVDLLCDTFHMVGYVRYQSSVGYTAVQLSKNLLYFQQIQVGGYTDLPVTLTASGTEDLPYIEGTTIGGADPDVFSVVGDTCKSQPLAAGASCTVTVRARPFVDGTASASLVVVHDGAAPYEVGLDVIGRDIEQGTYHAVSPIRVLDTRTGTGGRRGALPQGGVLHLALGNYLGEPASAVVLNLTVDRPQKPGYLTAYPTGTARPTTSSINFPAGWQGANLVTVPLGTSNQIDIYNYLGNTSVIADMVGYYAKGDLPRVAGSGGGYHPTAVQRLLDTRTSGGGKLPGGYYITIPVRYQNDLQAISALSVTITAVRPTGQGYLTAWDGAGGDLPNTSTLNFSAASGVISNAAIVPTSYSNSRCPTCAVIGILNMSAAPIDLVVDINGFFDDGRLPAAVRYRPLASPTRIVDSRSGFGTTPFGANTTHTIAAPLPVAGYDTIALDANITAVAPTSGTYVTVWPNYPGEPRPLASILNPNAHQTIANHAIAEVGPGNLFNLYNAAGTNNLLVDVSGTFELFPPTPPDQIPHQGGGPETAQAAGAASAGRNTAGVQPTVHAR